MQSRRSVTVRCARRALCAALAWSFGATLAQPSGLTVLHGGAVVQQSGSATTITTLNGAGTRHSALDWRSFDVGSGQSVFFSQPDALSLSINRVPGNDPSAILGSLASNGRLVLVNPAGITIGGGAVVDTAGFTASTLPMSAADAIAGRLRFDATGDKDRPGAVKVDGQVLARSGDVVLIGPRVETGSAALVEASGGDVVIAAGRKVELTGRGLEGIRMEVRAPDDRAVNLGTLKGDSVGIFAGQLRHSGLIQAKGATVSGGRVVLHGTDDVEVAGRIEAATPERGGSVWISGERLELKSSTTIDVSHLHGGGEILVGGGRRGQDARLQNAQRVEVDEGVQLKADATLSGNGGTVVVRSDDRLDFRGAISSRGAGGGSPGYVEVHAPDLRYRGKVNRSADAEEGTPGKGSKDGKAPTRAPGGKFTDVESLAILPVSEQPQEVQVAVREPSTETVVAIQQLAWMPAQSSGNPDAYARKVVIDAVQCTVTR